MEYIIETKNLCKSYEKKAAVTSLNMHVPSGEIYGFIGRNGSGKSTTLKMLCGLAHPTEGSIRLFGETMLQDSVYRRIGVLIETAGLSPVVLLMKICFIRLCLWELWSLETDSGAFNTGRIRT